jgi:hypothetical protein
MIVATQRHPAPSAARSLSTPIRGESGARKFARRAFEWLFPAVRVERAAALERALVAERIAREAHVRERALWSANRELESALRREISKRMAADSVLAIMASEGTALIIPIPELALRGGLGTRGH